MLFSAPILRIVALLALIIVLAVCLSPATDVPDTAMRAKSIALRIAQVLVALATALVGLLLNFLPTPLVDFSTTDGVGPSPPPVEDSLPLLC